MNILLTNCWLRSSYATLRSLTKLGHNVFISDTSRLGMCQFSKYKSAFDLYRSHYLSEINFVNDIVDICKKRDIDVIIPSHDETEILAKYEKLFSNSQKVFFPRFESSVLLNNKKLAYEIAQSTGIPVPKVFSYSDIEELRRNVADFKDDDFVVKLLKGNSSKGVFHCKSENKVIETVEDLILQYDLEPARFPQVELAVKGVGVGHSVFYWHGKKIIGFTHKRLREKIETGGTSVLREAIDLPCVETAADKILEELNWHGFAMVEFKYCLQRDTFWFIEVNPRLWGSLPLAIAAGADFPKIAVNQFQNEEYGKQLDCSYEIKNGWIGRWLLGDFMLVAKHFSTLKFSKALKLLLATKFDSLDDFHLDDPFAFIGQFLRYTYNSLRFRSLNPIETGMIR